MKTLFFRALSGKANVGRHMFASVTKWLGPIAIALAIAFLSWIYARPPADIRAMEVKPSEIRILESGNQLNNFGRIARTDDPEIYLSRQFLLNFDSFRQYHVLKDQAEFEPQNIAVYYPSISDRADFRVNGIPAGSADIHDAVLPGYYPEYILRSPTRNFYQRGLNRFDVIMEPLGFRPGMHAMYIGGQDKLAEFHQAEGVKIRTLKFAWVIGGVVSLICGATILLCRGNVFISIGLLSFSALCILIGAHNTLSFFGTYTTAAISLLLLISLCVMWVGRQHYKKQHSALDGIGMAAIFGATLFSILTIMPYQFGSHLTLVKIAAVMPLPLLYLGGPIMGYFALDKYRNVVKAQENELGRQKEIIEMQEAELVRELQSRAVLEERERFTRDMHDGIGGQLLSLLVRVRSGKADLDDVEKGIQDGLTDLRLVVDSLDNVGETLGAAMSTFQSRARKMLDAENIDLKWTQIKGLENIEIGTRRTLHLYRILQEALSNIARHAEAKTVLVEIFKQDGDLNFVICDDGKGFDPAGVSAGKGLRSMKARAKKLSADLDIKKNGKQSGTRVQLCLPIIYE